MYTNAEIEKVYEIEPLLTANGIGCYDSNFNMADIIEERKTIRLDHVYKVCELLKLCNPSKRINSKHSSYGLKHTIERHLGAYTGNGELIMAMLLSGFKHRRTYLLNGKLNPNCQFNISESDYKFLSSRFCNTW